MALAMALAGPVLLLRRGRHYWTTLPRRLLGERRIATSLPERRPAARPLWLHAVSVGEVGVAATLARALPPDLPLVVTTVTPTGQERAQALFRERAEVAYLPFDLDLSLGRFFRRLRPRALVLIEGDYWPLLLRRCRDRGLPVAVINGRLSDRSFPRLAWLARRAPRLLSPLLTPVERFGVQTAADRDRLLALGVPAGKVMVTGNLKFETPEPAAKPALEAKLAELAGGRPILVAGSTMGGEEEAVVDAFLGAGGGTRAFLLLAPRHPGSSACLRSVGSRRCGGARWAPTALRRR
jgi:3-deoxy-D-manno-octulosonic-acid transferase